MAAPRRGVAPAPGGARSALVLVCASSVALTMTVQGVLPAMPVLQEEFGISDAAVGWFTLVYVLPGVLFTIPLGQVAAALPRRAVFGGMLALYAVTGVAQAYVGTYEALLALRVVQGVAFAVAMPLTVVIIGEAYAGTAQVRAFATRQASVTTGEFLLPVAGGLLAALSWRGPLLVQGLTFVVAAAALLVLDDRRSPRPERRRGASLAAVRAQRRGAIVLTIGFARFFFKFSLLGYLPLLLVGRGATVAEAGVVLAIAAGGAGVMSTLVPRALRRVPASRLTAAGAALSGVSLLAFVALDDLYAAAAVGVLFGAADGIIAVMQDSYLTRSWGPRERPAVAAVAQTARNLGKATAPLAMTALVALGSVEAAFTIAAIVAFALAWAFATLGHLDGRFTEPQPGPVAVPEAAPR